MDQTVWTRVDGRDFPVSNLQKLFWPEEGYSKAHLLQYYLAAGSTMVQYLARRPLTVVRYPDGIHGGSFFQKNCPENAPDWIATLKIPRAEPGESPIRYCLANERAAILWLANQGAIEFHPWPSRQGTLAFPDWAIFDLDPAEPATFQDAVQAAFWVRQALDILGLRGYPKTSGATGIHVYVPVYPELTYSQITRFVHAVARQIQAAFPDRITLERPVARRKGKVYIDYLQNAPGKTIAAPYTVRPLPGAPVSTPVTWQELARGLLPTQFNILTVPQRLQQGVDPFRPVLNEPQSLLPFRKLWQQE
ncbi:MAG: non-homologous end-joining DNA ligase [Firmicutes bacterium]|nr:non-homologous end-joining DNA ligase [Bacillota bacterium]